MNILRVLLLLSVSCFTAVNYSWSQNESSPVFEMKEGDVLVYDVRNQGELFYLIVTVRDCKGNLRFDWEMTEPVSKKGTVEVKSKALSSSSVILNHCEAPPSICEQGTLIWMSKQLVKSLMGDEPVVMKPDGVTETKMVKTGTSRQTLTYKGKLMKVEVVDASNNGSFFDVRKLSFLNSGNNPIITRMNVGYTLQLMEVR